ncbi:MAG: glycosyltransferase family 2 protein [Bacteroidota bacterium]
MKLSIIIPAYNESRHVQQVLDALVSTAFTGVDSVEMIVVDDYSTDDTAEKVRPFIQQHPQVKLVSLEKNYGKGFAVKKGIEASDGDLIIIQDADMELVPSDIPVMMDTMKKLNVEFVNGSRYMPGIIRPLYSYRRYFFNKLFTRMAAFLVNTQLTDLACGYKLFTRNIYNQVKLKENRFGFEAELLIKVIRLKKTLIAEVPVHYFPRNAGDGKKIKNVDGFRIFWVIMKYGFLRMK